MRLRVHSWVLWPKLRRSFHARLVYELLAQACCHSLNPTAEFTGATRLEAAVTSNKPRENLRPMADEKRRANLVELLLDANPEVAAPPDDAAACWCADCKHRSALRRATSRHAGALCDPFPLVCMQDGARDKRILQMWWKAAGESSSREPSCGAPSRPVNHHLFDVPSSGANSLY